MLLLLLLLYVSLTAIRFHYRDYRHEVLRRVPRLGWLDGVHVSESERSSATVVHDECVPTCVDFDEIACVLTWRFSDLGQYRVPFTRNQVVEARRH
jgi:hypothetical protein